MTEVPSIHDDGELDMLVDPTTLDTLRDEHPQAFYTVAEGGEKAVAVVFRRFTPAEHKRVLEMLKNPRRADKAAETAANDIILFPKGADLQQLRDDCPAIDDRVGTLAMQIARGVMPEEAKKLRPSPGKPQAGTSLSTPAR